MVEWAASQVDREPERIAGVLPYEYLWPVALIVRVKRHLKLRALAERIVELVHSASKLLSHLFSVGRDRFFGRTLQVMGYFDLCLLFLVVTGEEIVLQTAFEVLQQIFEQLFAIAPLIIFLVAQDRLLLWRLLLLDVAIKARLVILEVLDGRGRLRARRHLTLMRELAWRQIEWIAAWGGSVRVDVVKKLTA